MDFNNNNQGKSYIERKIAGILRLRIKIIQNQTGANTRKNPLITQTIVYSKQNNWTLQMKHRQHVYIHVSLNTACCT